MSASDLVKRHVWVRCGGRCVICNEYLLHEHLESGDAVRAIGEVAHIAGESEGGPRGRSQVPVGERNDPDNLILLCPNDHRSADKKGRLADPLYTEDYLVGMKTRHEAFIEFVSGLRENRNTTVVRIFGGLRGAPTNIARNEAAAVVMSHAHLVPRYMPDPNGVGPEISLHDIANPVDEGYWVGALRQIDSAVERIHRDVAEGGTEHVSVFGITLVPLLAALGNRIDDTIAVDIYERHRTRNSWAWDNERAAVPFNFTGPVDGPSGPDAVLVINASGTVQVDELPEELQGLPVYVVGPADGTTPGPETFENSDTLNSYSAALRALFANLEIDSESKSIKRLHVFAAAPVSACVALGRALPVDNAAPSLPLYHRTGNSYAHALDLPA